jgi:DNA-binding NarL/FixJ family response regulator
MHPNQVLQTVEVGIVQADDKRRQYKAALINGSTGMRVVWACAKAKEALEALTRRCPNVVLVSLFLNDMPGTELIKRIRLGWQTASPILLIPADQSRRAVEALEAGACGYLPTPCPASELIRGIRNVHDGGAILEQPVARTIVEYFRARGLVMDRLTEREKVVLISLSDGLSKTDVVAKLGISKETLRTHVRNVLGKLGARSTTQAVALYLNPKVPVQTDVCVSTGKIENRTNTAAQNIRPLPSDSAAPAAPFSQREEAD